MNTANTKEFCEKLIKGVATTAVPTKVLSYILKVQSGEKDPKTPEQVKTFFIKEGVKKGDKVATEYGTIIINQQLQPTKYKGYYTNTKFGQAYLVTREYSQNAIILED
jgi:hypothetical protein